VLAVQPIRNGSASDADLSEHPLTPDTSFYRSIGMILNAPLLQSLIAPVGMQHVSYMLSFGIIGIYSPTMCRLETFSAAPADGLTTRGVDASVVRIAGGDVCEESSTPVACSSTPTPW
jgi:hypothetical protein